MARLSQKNLTSFLLLQPTAFRVFAVLLEWKCVLCDKHLQCYTETVSVSVGNEIRTPEVLSVDQGCLHPSILPSPPSSLHHGLNKLNNGFQDSNDIAASERRMTILIFGITIIIYVWVVFSLFCKYLSLSVLFICGLWIQGKRLILDLWRLKKTLLECANFLDER